MKTIQELLKSASSSRIDLKDIGDELHQLYGRSRVVLGELILELYEHYKNGECYVPCIEDVDPNLKLWCHRADAAVILNWIRGILFDIDFYEKDGRFESGNETIDEFVLSCIEDDIDGIDMKSHFQSVREAIKCIESELKKRDKNA